MTRDNAIFGGIFGITLCLYALLTRILSGCDDSNIVVPAEAAPTLKFEYLGKCPIDAFSCASIYRATDGDRVIYFGCHHLRGWD